MLVALANDSAPGQCDPLWLIVGWPVGIGIVLRVARPLADWVGCRSAIAVRAMLSAALELRKEGVREFSDRCGSEFSARLREKTE